MDDNEAQAEISVSFTDGRAVTVCLDDAPRMLSHLVSHLCDTATRHLRGTAVARPAITVVDSTGHEFDLTPEQAYGLATGLLRAVTEIAGMTRVVVADPRMN